MMDRQSGKPVILIVDDTPANVKLLVDALIQQYEVLAANNGETALLLANQENPDLILLDIMMPGLDGYDVCRRLKAQEATRQIPVLFITAMGSEIDEMLGLQIGAVDYITKPFSIPIVLARVATQLALHDSYARLEQQYVALREMDQLRKDVEAVVRHDMKSPIDGIIGCSSLLLHRETLSWTELQKFLRMILNAARQLREMVNLSLNLIKMEQGQYQAALQPVDLLPIIQRVLADHQTLIDTKESEILLLVNGFPARESDSFTVLGDDTLCYTMIANLFKNAVEASAPGLPVRIMLQENRDTTMAIHNQGVVPEAVRSRFFDKYVTHGKRGGTGLGTYSARLMAETQKGRIHMHSSLEEGTTVTIIFQERIESIECLDRR